MKPRLYREDPDFRMSPSRLSDEAYEEALSSLIIVCADALIVDRAARTVYLATRRALPLPGPWLIGGRISAGDLPEDGIAHLMKRETGLSVESARFTFLSMHRYLFTKRQQVPQEKGSDTLAYTYAVELSAEERASVVLDPEEYDASKGLRAYDRALLIEEGVHQAVVDLYDEVFGTRA